MITEPIRDPRALLAAAARAQVDQDLAHTRLLILAGQWADAHPLLDDDGPFADTGLRLSPEGVPTVACSAVAEFAAVLRMSSAAGEYLIGAALELRHRLPRIWAGVLAGTIRPGIARRIADRTLDLSASAAEHVDRHLCPVADRVTTAQIERTVADAVVRHMPDRAAERDRRRRDPRGVWITHDPGSPDTIPHTRLGANLDLHDGLHLEALIDADAAALRRWGVDEHEQVLRSMALGDLARRQPILAGDDRQVSATGGRADEALPAGRSEDDRRPVPGPVRPVTLFLHLNAETVLTGHGAGRVGGLQAPVELDLAKEWLTAIGATVTVKPVIDLNEPVLVDAYEIPDRIRERVTLREPTCVYPWCGKASTASGVDLDHIAPFAQGGATSTDNLAPLCRTHHRFKTHTGWHYRRHPDGAYEWTSPDGLTYRRERDGTLAAADRPPPGPIGEPPDSPVPRQRRRRKAEIDDCCAPPPVVDLTPPPF